MGGTGAGTCYLKNNLVAPNANANVDTAYITADLPAGNPKMVKRSKKGKMSKACANKRLAGWLPLALLEGQNFEGLDRKSFR